MWLWILLVLIPFVFCADKVCPDGTSICPNYATCCQLADLSYGCCPQENAVCCEDHIHCCPSNTKCQSGICIQLSGTNITAKRLDKAISGFGPELPCPENTTYCKGSLPGSYQCCPLSDGICCADFLHCCPQNYACNLKKQKCVNKKFTSEMYDAKKNGIFKFGSSKYFSILKPSDLNNVICPGSHQCPNGYTCCQLPNSDWGCCPFPKAVCCPDKLHCCPHNMKCDSTSQTCYQGHFTIPSLQKIAAKPFENVICPDNSTCAESSTCCRISEERFGCCPYEDAVCCEDLSHCCPNGLVCDVVEKRCV